MSYKLIYINLQLMRQLILFRHRTFMKANTKSDFS